MRIHFKALIILLGLGISTSRSYAASSLLNEQPRPSQKTIGAGIVLGAPTALTVKKWISETHAFDLGLGFFIGNHVLIYGDYLWHYPGLFGTDTPFLTELLPYVGVGGGIYFWSDHDTRPWGWRHGDGEHNDSVGLYGRIPFGIEWYPGTPPLGVFIELVPAVLIVPGIDLGLDAGLGVRYYF